MGELRAVAPWALTLAVSASAGMAAGASAQVADPLLGYPRIVVPGPVLRFETSEGVFRIALFRDDAPRLTRAFTERVEDGAFRQEGFWLTRPNVVQLGSPATDVFEAGSRQVESGSAGVRPRRDSVSTPFLATLGAHGFERTGLRPIVGSVMIDQRFIEDGQMVRREYFIALAPGPRRGEVVGHVISGLDVVKRLNARDGIREVRIE